MSAKTSVPVVATIIYVNLWLTLHSLAINIPVKLAHPEFFGALLNTGNCTFADLSLQFMHGSKECNRMRQRN